MRAELIDDATFSQLLRWAYARAVDPPAGLESAAVIAESHHRPVQTSLQMADEIVGWQQARTTVTGYFDQLLTVLDPPEGVPVPLAVFFYLQLRIAAAIAYGGGRELDTPIVRALVLSTLLVDGQADALQEIGLPADFIAKRSALKSLDDRQAATLLEGATRRLRDAVLDGHLSVALESVEAPWQDAALIQRMGATARRTFIVLHHW